MLLSFTDSKVFAMIMELLFSILTVLATYGITTLIAWLRSKVKNEKVKNALEEIGERAVSSVLYVEQTFVAPLKATQKWDNQTQKEALKLAVSEVYKSVSADTIKWFKDNKKDIEAEIIKQIEAFINKSKNKLEEAN